MRKRKFLLCPTVLSAIALLAWPSGCFFAEEDECGSVESSQDDDDLNADRNPNADDDATDDDATDDDATDDDATDDDTVASPPLELHSTEFVEGGAIPLVYTCDNRTIPGAPQWYSPPMYWLNAPEEVAAFAITIVGTDDGFVQWGLINIPADDDGLPAAVSPNGTLPGNSWEIQNGDGDPEYTGPCPPAGVGPQNYEFTLYALNAEVDAPVTAPATLENVLPSLEAASIEEATLTGTYERN